MASSADPSASSGISGSGSGSGNHTALDLPSHSGFDSRSKRSPSARHQLDVEKGIYTQQTATVERAKQHRIYPVFLCGLFIVLEVSKQNVAYAVLHDNAGRYPIDPAALVVAAELLKLIFSAGMLLRNRPAIMARLSIMYAVPAAMYVVTNNLYLYSLNFVLPATWTLLSQSRIVMTALVYRLIFGRQISTTRWVSLTTLTVGVVLSQLNADLSGISITPYALVLSLISSAVSVGTSIFVEQLLKNHTATFYEQQVQLYAFGLGGAMAYWVYSSAVPANVLIATSLQTLSSLTPHISFLVWSTVLLSGVGGIVVAAIIKQLDNLAKIFSLAIAIVLIGVSGMLLFPDSTNIFTTPFCVGTVLIVISTIVYSMDNFPSLTSLC